jgi:hypothetical protein
VLTLVPAAFRMNAITKRTAAMMPSIVDHLPQGSRHLEARDARVNDVAYCPISPPLLGAQIRDWGPAERPRVHEVLAAG